MKSEQAPMGPDDEVALCRVYDCPSCGRTVLMRDDVRQVSHESPVCDEFHQKILELLGREPTYLASTTVQLIALGEPEGEPS